MTQTNKYHVPAIERALDLIDLLASNEKDLSFSEILLALKIPRPSLARILKALTDRGIINKAGDKGRYRLGMKLIYLGNRLESKLKLGSVARPFMEQLATETGKTIELCTLDRDQLILIDQVEGSEGMRLFSRIGSAYPYFHTIGAGKIYLAHMEKEKRRDVLQRIGLPMVTRYTIVDMDQLEEEFSGIIKNGYAFEDQELREGVRRVVAPIYDCHGSLAGCIGIAAPIFSFRSEDREHFGRMVKEVAEKISSGIGASKKQ
jgi:DNA-binding IclR family transcriptional regulator